MVELGGFVGLAALMIALFAWLRGDVRALRVELKDEIAQTHTALRDEIAHTHTALKDEIDLLRKGQEALREGQHELRERMARLEGMLDGLREAVTRHVPRDAA